MAADEWFVKAGKIEIGPITRRHLDGMVRRGEIEPTSPVRHGDKGAWRPAKSVPGLFDDAAEDARKSGKQKGEDLGRAAKEASAGKAEPTPQEELQEFFGELTSSWAPWAILVGGVAVFATWRWPSWIAGAGHYAGLIALVAGVGELVKRQVEDSKLTMAAFYLAAVAAVGAWGWFDVCIETSTTPEGVLQRDTVRRFSRAIIHRERTHRSPGVDYRAWGPTLPDGTPHGRWQMFWTTPAENNNSPDNVFWYWRGLATTEADFIARQQAP